MTSMSVVCSHSLIASFVWLQVNTYTFHTAQSNGAPVLLQVWG